MSAKVDVKVLNRTAFLSRPYDYDALIKHWSFTVPNYRFIIRNYPGWDGRIKLLKRDRLPAGLFWATKKEIEEKEHIKFKIDSRDIGITSGYEKKKWLVSDGKYAFQNDCVDEMCRKAYCGGLILNATGSGKTRIAAMFASRAMCDILFIVDQLVLLRQAREEIGQHLKERIGYVGESE